MSNFRNWSALEDTSGAVVREDGSVEVEHKILVYGPQEQGGRKFEVTPEAATEMARNHAADVAMGYEPPLFIGHPKDRSSAPAVGWVKRIRAAADGVYAVMSFLPEMAEAIRKGMYRYVSPTFAFEYPDQRGNECGAKVLDVGILNTPHQKDLGPIPLADVAYQLTEAIPAEETRRPTPEGDHMDETKLSELVAAKVAEYGDKLKAELSEMFGKKAEECAASSVAALAADVNRLTTTVVELRENAPKADASAEARVITELRETLKVQGDTLADLRNAKDSRDITDLVSKALELGALDPCDVPGFGTDKFKPIEWLSASKFNGIRGLNLHVATAKPSGATSRKSAPVTDAGVKSLSELPRASMFKDADEFEKFANMGNGGDPRQSAAR